MQQITSLIGDDLQKVETELVNALNSKVPLITKVGGYIIASGGKRFRPLLYLLVAKCCHYSGEHNIPLACVFEYIHTATLLHDDVLDHAETRRGNSSVNSVWGDRTSMLVGDFLFSKAFSLLVKTGNLRSMQVISEGETMQTARGGNTDLTEEEYIAIVSNKTASLIEAACQVGAIMGNSSPERENNFKNYGLSVGIAFQMVDDTLDYTSEDEKFGKALYKDLQEGKVTLPLIHTLKQASAEDRQMILSLLQNGSLSQDNVDTIIQLIKKYEGVSYVLTKAREYVDSALNNLQELDPSPLRDALVATAHYVVERKW
jgi:octaprenyl-diphosphate synthase